MHMALRVLARHWAGLEDALLQHVETVQDVARVDVSWADMLTGLLRLEITPQRENAVRIVERGIPLDQDGLGP